MNRGNPLSFNLSGAKIELTGMSRRAAMYPVGTIVEFFHEEITGSVYPELMKRPTVELREGCTTYHAPSFKPPAKLWCHGYVQGLRFDGEGKTHYELSCIEHAVRAETREWDMRTIGLLDQLALASAVKLA